MASAVKWEAVWTSRGTVLTTELNSLANGAYSAVGTEIDNSVNLDQYGKAEIYLGSLSPAAGAYVQLHMNTAPGGTNYEDVPAAANPANHTVVAVIPLNTTATSVKRVMTPMFVMQPAKTKFVLYNAAGVALAATTNTVTLYTTNDESQ